jgi:adenylate cyclase
VSDGAVSELSFTQICPIITRELMARENIGRLLVVDRSDPTRLVGYLGRTGIADAWRELVHEEEVREAGWVTSRVRLLRRNVRRVLSRSSV